MSGYKMADLSYNMTTVVICTCVRLFMHVSQWLMQWVLTFLIAGGERGKVCGNVSWSFPRGHLLSVSFSLF